MSSPPPPRRRPAPFRPQFSLLLLYLCFFFVVFGLLFALPELFRAIGEIPAGSGPLPAEELERAREVSREALRGRIPLVLGCAAVATGLGAWARRLPGLR